MTHYIDEIRLEGIYDVPDENTCLYSLLDCESSYLKSLRTARSILLEIMDDYHLYPCPLTRHKDDLMKYINQAYIFISFACAVDKGGIKRISEIYSIMAKENIYNIYYMISEKKHYDCSLLTHIIAIISLAINNN